MKKIMSVMASLVLAAVSVGLGGCAVNQTPAMDRLGRDFHRYPVCGLQSCAPRRTTGGQVVYQPSTVAVQNTKIGFSLIGEVNSNTYIGGERVGGSRGHRYAQPPPAYGGNGCYVGQNRFYRNGISFPQWQLQPRAVWVRPSDRNCDPRHGGYPQQMPPGYPQQMPPPLVVGY